MVAKSLLILLVAILPWVAQAEEKKRDIYDLTDIVAVQNRAFEFHEALGLGSGYLPSDAFNHGFTASAFYTFEFSDLWAWEILNYQYVINRETQTKKDLINQGFAVQAGDGGKLDYPVHLIETGVVFTPLYNKGLLFNRSLTYGEVAFYLGAGEAIYHETGTRILLTPGIQYRFYLSRGFALRAHFKEHFYNDTQQGLNGLIDVGLSLEIQTRFFSSRAGSP